MRDGLMALLVALSLALPARAADYVQAPDSALAFAGKYQGAMFTGRFPDFSSRLRFDPRRPAEARLEVNIPLASVATSNPEYDPQLRGSAFFDADRFPQATYVANGFRPLGDNRYAADGILTLHGVSKPVTLTFTWTPGPAPMLRGRATVQRLRFGIGGGQWADLQLIPDAIAVSARVVFKPR